MLNLKYNYFEIDLKSKKHRSEFYMVDILTINCKSFKEWQLRSRIKVADSIVFLRKKRKNHLLNGDSIYFNDCFNWMNDNEFDVNAKC